MSKQQQQQINDSFKSGGVLESFKGNVLDLYKTHELIDDIYI